MSAPVRVLIVDDSAIVRRVLSEQLARQPGIEVAGTAPDPYVAREKIVALQPDVITLDIEMPRMDGLSFLRKLMKFHPVPAIILSSIAQRGTEKAIECLEAGAIAVLAKPDGSTSVGDVAARLGEIIRGVKGVRIRRAKAAPGATGPAQPGVKPARVERRPSRRLIAIGASTGGTEALRDVLTSLEPDVPGMVVVQHMPAGFTNAFAERLNGLCRIEVREARDGDRVCTGLALVAPGDRQMKVVRADDGCWAARVFDGPRVCRHRPSVEVLFQSVAEVAGAHAMGVMMTGMGNDGARAMRSMRDAGAFTVAQNQESCVVFGMPREAIAAGGVCETVGLDRIAEEIGKFARGRGAWAA